MKKDSKDAFCKGLTTITADLCNLQFPMACMFNAISEYDFDRIGLEYKEDSEERTNSMLYGALVIYQFAFFENLIEWSVWKSYEGDTTVDKLIAYRHIRHAYAHSADAKRVYREGNARDIEKEKFDLIMRSENLLRGVSVTDKDYISINYDSIMELNSLLRSVSLLHICQIKKSQFLSHKNSEHGF